MTEELEREIGRLMTGADFDLDKLRALIRRETLQRFRDRLNPDPSRPRWARKSPTLEDDNEAQGPHGSA
jgi:hypothetical protein